MHVPVVPPPWAVSAPSVESPGTWTPAAALALLGPLVLRWSLVLLLKPRCDGQCLPARAAGNAQPDHQRWMWWGLLGREGKNKAG